MKQITKTQLLKKLGYLEFVNDQLFSELKYLDVLLRSIGFPEGLATVKLAAQELKQREISEEVNDENVG
jgi:hypothetical protein